MFIHHAVSKVQELDCDHYLGQKGMPMFASLHNFAYEKMNVPDMMHANSRYVHCHALVTSQSLILTNNGVGYMFGLSTYWSDPMDVDILHKHGETRMTAIVTRQKQMESFRIFGKILLYI